MAGLRWDALPSEDAELSDDRQVETVQQAEAALDDLLAGPVVAGSVGGAAHLGPPSNAAAAAMLNLNPFANPHGRSKVHQQVNQQSVQRDAMPAKRVLTL
jgi:hypothetical protein